MRSVSLDHMIVRGGTFGPVATNTYVLADGQGGTAWIVDPAMGSAGWVEQTLSRIGATPELVLNTHGHWDHVVENHVWADRGLPVWVAAEDADWVRAPAPFNPALFGNPPPTPGVEPARLLADGEVLTLGEIEITPRRGAVGISEFRGVFWPVNLVGDHPVDADCGHPKRTASLEVEDDLGSFEPRVVNLEDATVHKHCQLCGRRYGCCDHDGTNNEEN